MQSKIQSLIDENFVIFSLLNITTKLNANGEEKKTPNGMPNWRSITKDNFRDFIKPTHSAMAIITGKMSGITVIDFDDYSEYEKMLEKYPDLKNHRTIRTKKGVHLYCKYDESIKDTVQAMNSYKGVDIRNDGGIVFCPPTKYKLLSGAIAKYEDLGGEILPTPDYIVNDLKQNTPAPTQMQTQQTNQIQMPTYNKVYPVLADYTYIEKVIDNGSLDFKALSGSWNDWRDIGFIFKQTADSPESLRLFHKFSRINKDIYDEEYTNAFWKTIKQPIDKKPLTIGTLKMWLNKDRVATNDVEAAKYIYNDLSGVLKSVDGRIFYCADHIWLSEMTKINDSLLYVIQNSNIYMEKSRTATNGEGKPYVQNISKAKNVLETLLLQVKAENNDPRLYEKFHSTTKGKLCFNDGVLDFKTKTFTQWQNIPAETIFPTVKINRNYGDYFASPTRNVINEIVKKILEPLYGNKLKTALHFLSRALAGHHEDKRWATYLGNRNCGKGVEYDLMAAAFESYVATFELGNIMYCNKSAGLENVDCSKKLYWLLDLEFVRLAVSQEVPESKSGMKVNSKQLKKMTGGGDTIVARRNYDRQDTHFKIDATFYAKGNYTLLCDSSDCDETRVEFESVNQFCSQDEYEHKKQEYDEQEMQRFRIADATIKDKCLTEEWKNAIVYLIMESYQEISVPVIREIMDDDNNDMIPMLKKKYTFTNLQTDFILVADVNATMIDYDKKKLAVELQSRNIFKKKCNTRISKHFSKWCYYGIKEIPRIDSNMGETDEEKSDC